MGGGRAVRSHFDNFATLLMKETPVGEPGFSADHMSGCEYDFRSNGQANEKIAADAGNVGLATRETLRRV